MTYNETGRLAITLTASLLAIEGTAGGRRVGESASGRPLSRAEDAGIYGSQDLEGYLAAVTTALTRNHCSKLLFLLVS